VERRQRFEQVFDENLRAVYAYVLRRADRGDADDAVAEVFLVAWRRIDDVPRDAKPWLLGVARRVLANQRRASARRAALHARTRSDATPAPVDRPDVPTVLVALRAVSPRDREVLMLVAWDGLSVEEAATVLGCSRGAAKVRFHRAKRRLARALAELEDVRAAGRLGLEGR
jgi:RNA polymerase sigma-70 factor (ECF subfamily)